MRYAPPAIEDYAAIGDGRSVALVSSRGSIDWLCWPRFDSPSLFASLLDPVRGGHWSIAPVEPARVTRTYVQGTNVLTTRFDVPGGSVTLTDLMTLSPTGLAPEHELLRIVTCNHGTVELQHSFAPRPDFGRRGVLLRDTGKLGIRAAFGAQLVTLRGEPAPQIFGEDASGRFTLLAGQRAVFSLTHDTGVPAVLTTLGDDATRRVDRTITAWRAALPALPDLAGFEAEVERSLLAIQLLAFAPSGAIIAAPTTSLPERLGGDLNWDYRYCWLRDASFTTRALIALGEHDRAAAFATWLLHATRLTRPALGVLYDVYGNSPHDEGELAHLAGHRGSLPVRVRNKAASQLQLDIYGEVIDAAIQILPDGGRIDRETSAMLADFGRFVCERWRCPDHSLWEVRGEPRHYTHSKVLCWVALDRLLSLHARCTLPGLPEAELTRERAAIRADVLEHGFDPRLGSFVADYDRPEADAALLQLGWYGFEPPDSPRMRGTHRLIEERLRAGPGLYYRYEHSPQVGEGAFGICSFWVAEHLAQGGGTLDEARAAFAATARHANDVGLFAEEIDPASGAALGNFPQAYTHVGLINAALSIAERQRREAAP